MSNPLGVRPVWLTEADAERFGLSQSWKRATKDPESAAAKAVAQINEYTHFINREESSKATIHAVLKALGYYV